MDPYRFYVAAFAPPTVGLPEDQSHHAQRVLRLETGAQVLIFDGHGKWALGTLRTEKRGVFVDLVGDLHQDPPPPLHLTLATAAPKADRAEWLVEQASQLGAARVAWLDTDRAVVKPKDSGGKMDKFRRLALESAKQCGRTHLLTIAPMRTLDETLAAARTAGDTLLWLEPRAGKTIRELALPATGRVTALIGPEGGWSDREISLLESQPDLLRVRLTPEILRIETACTTIAALLLAQ